MLACQNMSLGAEELELGRRVPELAVAAGN
jgi:hypothetical protein